jgi:hypothetical protein
LVHSMIERPALPARRRGEPSEPLRRWVTAAVAGILTGNEESERPAPAAMKPATRRDVGGLLRQ